MAWRLFFQMFFFLAFLSFVYLLGKAMDKGD